MSKNILKAAIFATSLIIPSLSFGATTIPSGKTHFCAPAPLPTWGDGKFAAPAPLPTWGDGK
jgi:hypothetical protein